MWGERNLNSGHMKDLSGVISKGGTKHKVLNHLMLEMSGHLFFFILRLSAVCPAVFCSIHAPGTPIRANKIPASGHVTNGCIKDI